MFNLSAKLKKEELFLIFLRAFFFFSCIYTACIFYDTWVLSFHANIQYRGVKFLVSFCLPFLSCFFLMKKEKNLNFVKFTLLAVQILNVIIFIVEKQIVNKITNSGEIACTSKVIYVNLCLFAVFSAIFLFRILYKNIDFYDFYNFFFKAYSITFIFTLLMIFVLSRTKASFYSVNYLLFTGEIKDLFINIFKLNNIKPLFRTVGNVLLFAPFSMMILAFYKGKKAKYAVLFTFLLSFAIEFCQFVFKNGKPEIDDLFLNTLGGLIGIFIFEKIIKKIYIKDRLKSEEANSLG